VEIRQNRLRQFVDDYLCLDGVTILRLIEANSASKSSLAGVLVWRSPCMQRSSSSGVVTSDIVYELWKAFDDAGKL
jgi:hypothetical protein